MLAAQQAQPRDYNATAPRGHLWILGGSRFSDGKMWKAMPFRVPYCFCSAMFRPSPTSEVLPPEREEAAPHGAPAANPRGASSPLCQMQICLWEVFF